MKSITKTIGFTGLIGIAFLLSSCEIEGLEVEKTGSIAVSARDTTGSVVQELIGGSIFLDGVIRNETTPDTLELIPIGDHLVRVKATGYESGELEVTVNENDVVAVSLSLLPAQSGLLEVTSDPTGADIIIDLILANQITPFAFNNIEVGVREVSVFLNGHKTLMPALKQAMVVDLETPVTVDFTLEAGTAGSQEGNVAYDFTLYDDFGNLVSLHNYRGHVVLLTFFFRDCVGCNAEFPEIQDAYENYLPYGVQVIGIDPMWLDDLEDVQFVRNTHALTFKLVMDNYNGQISQVNQQYCINLYPTNIFISQTGEIVERMNNVTYADLAEIFDGLLGL